MEPHANVLKQRSIERFFLLLVSLVLALLFLNLYNVLQKSFATVPQRLQDGTMVNLNDAKAAQKLKTLLQTNFYFEDRRDIQLAASVLEQGLNGNTKTLDNIGELNKRSFFVDAEKGFAQGGESFQKRVQLSRLLIGFSGPDSIRYEQEKKAPPVIASTTNVGLGNHTISGTITDENSTAVAGVLVRLTMLLPQDSIYSNAIAEVTKQTTETSATIIKGYAFDSLNNKQLQSLVAYARTGSDGKYAFQNLPQHKAFDVLPLQPGFQFGPSKGTADLDNNERFSFVQQPHQVRLFSSRDFTNLKSEKALIVRTPQQFNRWFWIIVSGFFLSFFSLHLFLSMRAPKSDGVLLPVLMLLTGLSFITLLAMQDALSDRFLAKSMFGYFVAGMIGIFLLQAFNLRRFTTDAKLYRLFVVKNDRLAANGLPWAALAALLLILTILFGSGPEGSGVKVNLLGVQPSEVVKFFTVIFLAVFFATNEKMISEYSRWQTRWAFFRMALFAILLTIFLFLILGDLGPAIVCCFTFIVLFSFSRGDFLAMSGAVLLYILLIWGFEKVWLATAIEVALLAVFFAVRKEVSESAVMTVFVLAAFLLLDQISFLAQLFPGPISRLIERKAIWQNAWNNEVFGGDHVANSIWAMASGGVTGQGFGNSFSKTIPEAHTDMILPAIGEVFGAVVIASVCLLFLLYLHRALLIGRQSGTPFLFYLCAGLGVSTFIQFVLIAGGSTGALPLSGVSLPFVSYGGSSLVCNLLAAGVLLSCSAVRGTAVQMRYITKQQDKNLMPALVAGCLGALLLLFNVGRYCINNKKWIVEPALVADRSGARQFSYNPRISVLMKRLDAGALYDRNHLLLATSKPEQLRQQQDSFLLAGLEPYKLDVLQHRRQQRYYPFGEQLFFWTGDANTGIFTGGNNGYFAEYQHGPALRGFNTPATTVTATASHFHEARFLPQTMHEMTLSKLDYSALAPLLLAGINSDDVKTFKQQNRDVQLAIDARLQTRIQKALSGDEAVAGKRVSVVVMNDSTGDVLASAMYPLPPVEDWERLNTTASKQPFNRITNTDLGFTYATQPGSTAKLATTVAAFNKLGLAATQKTFVVRNEDRIRVHSEEPDETGTIGLERALVKSNNVYFIRLANEEALQEEMATVYQQTGMFLRGVGGYFFDRDMANVFQQAKWRDLWRATEFRSRARYDKTNIRATRGLGISGMAWGQGELVATPAAVARLASGIANNGVLIPNRFVLKIGDSATGIKKGNLITSDKRYAQLLANYMKEQSAGKVADLKIKVAGKTGTPERMVAGKRINDGWYVFFAPNTKGENHTVVCVRIEDCKGSSEAVKLAGRDVIPALLDMGYLKSFETGKKQ